MHQTDTAVDYVPDNARPEIWREVPGWPYAVSTHGRVMRTQGAAATHVGRITTKIHIQNETVAGSGRIFAVVDEKKLGRRGPCRFKSFSVPSDDRKFASVTGSNPIVG